MIISLFLLLTLFDSFNGTARKNLKTNAIIAVATGIMTPDTLIFIRKSKKNPGM